MATWKKFDENCPHSNNHIFSVFEFNGKIIAINLKTNYMSRSLQSIKKLFRLLFQ